MRKYSVDWESCFSGTPKNELERLQYYCELTQDRFGGNIFLAIEIGSHEGASAALLSEWFPNVLCVDPWGVEEPLSSAESIASFVHSPGTNVHFPNFMKNMERLKIWNKRVIPIVGTSLALDGLPILGAELVFVDNGHTLPDCSRDIEKCLRHLRPNGLLVCHDYKRGDLDFDSYWGVGRAVDEAIEKYNLEILDHFCGIVALQRKKPNGE